MAGLSSHPRVTENFSLRMAALSSACLCSKQNECLEQCIDNVTRQMCLHMKLRYELDVS